jgi:hypothetical protein
MPDWREGRWGLRRKGRWGLRREGRWELRLATGEGRQEPALGAVPYRKDCAATTATNGACGQCRERGKEGRIFEQGPLLDQGPLLACVHGPVRLVSPMGAVGREWAWTWSGAVRLLSPMHRLSPMTLIAYQIFGIGAEPLGIG